MEEIRLPNSQSPTPIGLTGYDNLEFRNSETGVEHLLANNDGFILGRIADELLRYRTDAHLLTIAPTGAGKGTGLIIPNLLEHNGSALVIDIRGETVAKTADARRLKGQSVVVIDPFEITNGQWGKDSYNPLDRLLKDPDGRHADDLIQRLATALMFDPEGRSSSEPIWDNATKNLISGLISYCVRYWPPYKQNIREIEPPTFVETLS